MTDDERDEIIILDISRGLIERERIALAAYLATHPKARIGALAQLVALGLKVEGITR